MKVIKKIFATMAAVCCLTGTFAFSACKKTYSSSRLKFVTQGDYCYVDKYNSFLDSFGLIEVPAYHDGLPVRYAYGFENKSALKSIKFGYNVENIGSFQNCKNLKSVYMGSNIKRIMEETFQDCTSLSEIDLCNVEQIDRDAFRGCDSLEKLYLPYSVKMFYGYSPLSTSYINSEYASVNSYDANLKEVTIETADFPLYGSMFGDCRNLEKIVIEDPAREFYSVDGVVMNKNDGTLVIGNKTNFIPNDGSVKIIGTNAYIHREFTEFTVPDSVQVIKHGAFASCVNLEKIILPKGSKWQIDNVTVGDELNKEGVHTFVLKRRYIEYDWIRIN